MYWVKQLLCIKWEHGKLIDSDWELNVDSPQTTHNASIHLLLFLILCADAFVVIFILAHWWVWLVSSPTLKHVPQSTQWNRVCLVPTLQIPQSLQWWIFFDVHIWHISQYDVENLTIHLGLEHVFDGSCSNPHKLHVIFLIWISLVLQQSRSIWQRLHGSVISQHENLNIEHCLS